MFFVCGFREGGGGDISPAMPSLLVISALHHVVFARPGFNYTHTLIPSQGQLTPVPVYMYLLT